MLPQSLLPRFLPAPSPRPLTPYLPTPSPPTPSPQTTLFLPSPLSTPLLLYLTPPPLTPSQLHTLPSSHLYLPTHSISPHSPLHITLPPIPVTRPPILTPSPYPHYPTLQLLHQQTSRFLLSILISFSNQFKCSTRFSLRLFPPSPLPLSHPPISPHPRTLSSPHHHTISFTPPHHLLLARQNQTCHTAIWVNPWASVVVITCQRALSTLNLSRRPAFPTVIWGSPQSLVAVITCLGVV